MTALLRLLTCLDELLNSAFACLTTTERESRLADRFRGLHISNDDVKRAISRRVGGSYTSTPSNSPWREIAEQDPRLSLILDLYALDDFQIATIVFAIASEIDLEYTTIFAFLQDDVTRKRPSVGLVLNLLCHTADERLARQREFLPGGGLLVNKLISCGHVDGRSLLASEISIDGQILRFLTGDTGLEPCLTGWCRSIARPGDGGILLGENVERRIHSLSRAILAGRSCRVFLRGREGMGREAAAARLASLLGRPLLVADLAALLARETDIAVALQTLAREALLSGAMVLLREADAFADAAPPYVRRLLQTFIAESPLLALAGSGPAWVSGQGIITIAMDDDDIRHRHAQWHAALIDAGLPARPDEVALLADRLRLTPVQIRAAVAGVRSARQQDATETTHLDALFTAARDQGGHALATLATRVEPRFGWDDLVLPDDPTAQLRELQDCVRLRGRVMQDWGFRARLPNGHGLSALFAGPSGTGKTMAAGVIAREIRLDLYRIDLSRVVNKYLGETEKNLDRVFSAAQEANAVLFFDEADAMFGKRAEVHDARDRYANLEISYLLQKMEEYEGLAVLATNLLQNMDEAFLRRLDFVVHFPFPQAPDRERIWRAAAPAGVPMAEDVDFAALAARFKLSGGNIRNIVLAACYRAAAGDGVLAQAHLLHATRREFQKLGKQITDAELHGRRPGPERGL